MPPMRIELLEHADPDAPYGLKGVGEPPNISTPPAIAAALRAATGRELARIPVRPEHIVGLDEEAQFVAATARSSSARRGSPRRRGRAARSPASTTSTPHSWPWCARRRASASSRSSAPTPSSPGARRRPAS
jgi:hypothetical protein